MINSYALGVDLQAQEQGEPSLQCGPYNGHIAPSLVRLRLPPVMRGIR